MNTSDQNDWEDEEKIEKEEKEKELLNKINKFYENLNEKFERHEIINNQKIKQNTIEYTWKNGKTTSINEE